MQAQPQTTVLIVKPRDLIAWTEAACTANLKVAKQLLFNAVVSVFLFAITACGGGGASGNQPHPVPSTITSVLLVCTPSTVATNATSQCTATVQGTGNFSPAVTWSASSGTIDANGLLTAPASAGSVTVTAASTQDTSKSGAASVIVQLSPPTIVSVSVACNPATVTISTTSQCAATVQGTGNFGPTVTWSASSGTIDANGLLTAPASAGSVTVTATSTQDTTKSGAASVIVQLSPPTILSISVACNPATVTISTTSQCTATVQGTGNFSPAVTWSASSGTIDANGLLTAPASAGSVTVTATSTQDTTKSSAASVTVQLQTPPSKHVVIVMEENHSYSTVVGNISAWPNLNKLISTGSLPTNYYAVSHPSIGNYFMLTTGQLLTTNDNSITVWSVDNVARRMLAAGVTFKVYAEGITQGYVGGNTGLYVIRHNPFAMLSDVADSTQVADQCIWPFTQFATDLASGTLPELSFIVPDINDDAHSGTPQQADAWLQANVVIPSSSYPAFNTGGDGILIVVFDEAVTSDTTYGGGHVATVLWGPNVKVGFVQTSSTVYQHESMLRTVMEALGLSNFPGAAATAPSMSEFFVAK
jgi:3-polyprenyl-4-hydroxybenzoate decarboxylase